MYSPKPHKKAKTGSVQVRNSNNRLQLVFTFNGERRCVSIGLRDTPFNRKQAQDKALEVERDIAYGEADCHYGKYAPLVEFLFFTGCRLSEALALQWKHISQQVITFRRVLIHDGKKSVIQDGLKTQKLRKFSVNAQLAEIIAAIKPETCDPESRNTLESLLENAAKLKAITAIIREMEAEKVPDNDPQLVAARDIRDNVQLRLLSAMRETFTTLTYLSSDGLLPLTS